ncbi:MAG TPA: LacI family DNA-binding transcriptional regulator [Terriglobales bacterium]|nr:LacI family DNA-binding transcriptional regulator [Terriglobales bacterium]
MSGRLNNGKEPGTTTLKSVARHVGLSAGTVSSVLNNSPSAAHIPQTTRDRIHAAARELNYRPNLLARSLRKQRTYTLGIIANDLGDAYTSLVIAGIEKFLRQNDYFFISGVHHHKREQLDAYSDMLMQRGVEGLIMVDWNAEYTSPLPTVAVSGHRQSEGVTNIILNHHSAIFSGLKHLVDLGHKDIAFMRGHPASADAETRWQSICEIAPQLGITVKDELVIQFDVEEFSPELGYPFAKQLLARNKPFTALFAYNDLSAIGAMRAFQESGLRVPQDISVIGFDDIPIAVYYYPSLTTLRQPLGAMGELAARTLVERIEGKEVSSPEIAVEGELVVRESTGPVGAGSSSKNRTANLVKA